MKKTLVFVLLLGIIGTFAFAQSAAPALKFTGYMNFGAQIYNDGTNTNLVALGSDSWTQGRLYLNGSYTTDTWGLAFRLAKDGSITPALSNANANLYIDEVWGWTSILNGMVKFEAGQLADYSWASNGWMNFGNFDSGKPGIQLQLLPVTGLNFGVYLPIRINGNQTNLLSDAMATLAIGANYTATGIGYLSLGYQLGQNATGVDATSPYLWAGVGYTGMSALTAKVELKMLSDSNTALNYTYINQQIGYNMAPLNLTLWAEEQLNGTGTPGTILHFQPVVDYTVGAWDLGAFFSYLTDSTSTGYGPGVFAKATVAKGATIAIGAEYDAGTAVSATQNTSGGQKTNVIGAPYDPIGGTWTPGTALQTDRKSVV